MNEDLEGIPITQGTHEGFDCCALLVRVRYLCRFHFGSSSDSAGGACGLPWWRSLSDRLLRRPLRRSPMYLIAFKPVGPGRSSRRAPDYHSAVLGSIDLSETEMPESRILEAAEWASECYAAAMTPRSEDDAGRGKGPLRVR